MPFDYVNYKRLEYVQSSGTQYINTGIKPSNNMELNATIMVTSANIGTLMGSGLNDDDLVVFWSTRSSTVFRYIAGKYPDKSKDITITDFINRKLVYKQIISPTEQSAYVNGELVGSSTYSASGNDTAMYLFGRKFNGSFGSVYNGKIYDISLIKDGIEVFHYIPAKRRSDSVIGMYDEVNNVFYDNDGAGNFIAGPEVFPCTGINARRFIQSRLSSGYIELAYIQSSGTQLIKSGYNFNSDTDTLEVQYENMGGTASYKWCFGSYASSSDGMGITSGINTARSNLYYRDARSVSSSYFTGEHTFLADSDGVSIDGANVASFLHFTSPSTLYLFGVNGGSNDNTGSYKIYSYKHTRNGSTLLNLIPAKNRSNVLGMYDLATGQFFTNAGTGDFIAGPEVNNNNIHFTNQRYVLSRLPSGYTELESIRAETTGPYIQLNYGFDDTDEIEIKSKLSGSGADKYLVSPATWNTSENRFAMGGRYNSSQRAIAFGSSSTGNTIYQPPVTPIDGQIATEFYSNNVFTIIADNINSTKDCSSISFGTETDNLRLFFGYNAVNVGYIYYWKHKKLVNGILTLVEDLVPARRNSDSVLGMYDLVTNQFFTNVGTGDFIAGPEVSTQIKLSNTRINVP